VETARVRLGLLISSSDPELISAETLLSNRANVTFFSIRSSDAESCPEKLVSLTCASFGCGSVLPFLSLAILKSDNFILLLGGAFADGDIKCWRICFFSEVFFEGVELVRFFLGDGEPARINGLSLHGKNYLKN